MSRRVFRTLPHAVLAPIAALAACTSTGPGPDQAAIDTALGTISAPDLVEHIQVLASDEFEGRAPSSRGEELTVAYLAEQFESMGLQPGNDGSWYQDVPLVSITADPSMSLMIESEGAAALHTYGEDFIAWTTRVVEAIDLMDSELVFVGYGIVAPEYDWNDYENLDVTGKTVVILVNDPGYATGEPDLFNGRSMTYYGRWTYKYEEAARQGAAGALIVHETGPAGYPWSVVSGSWSGPQFDLVSADNNMSRIEVEGWFSAETAHGVFAMAGLDLEEMKAAALRPAFEAIPMGLTASVALRNTIRRSESKNVLGLLPGTDRSDEFVIYMAHWDHLGRDTSLEGDQIYNGALDNASGTAALLELAQAFASLQTAARRSVLFIAVTAEEQGLLGSAHYGVNPVVPLSKSVAAINMDGINTLGPMTDMVVVGYGNSELDVYMATAAAAQGRVLRPDPEPEKGYYYRSDHFSLAKQGLPAIYTDTGTEHVERGVEWVTEQKDKYTEENYHKPSDEYSPDWDLSGAVQDIQLYFMVGFALANEDSFPNWREGTEFRAIRDRMMAGSR